MLFSSSPRVVALQELVAQQAGVELPTAYFALPRGKFPFESLPLELRATLLQQAGWLLAEWPHRFITLGKACNLTSTPLLQDMRPAPFWYESVVMENFYVSNINRRFDKVPSGKYHSDDGLVPSSSIPANSSPSVTP
ncbi:MAG: hypothetical protein ACRYG7_18805 [Janthinobacterium lividum]